MVVTCVEEAAASHGDAGPLAPAGSILIIEDDAGIAPVIAARLANAGYATVVVNDGGEALATACGPERFDAIVLDRLLPTLDGMLLLDELRRRDNHTPVLMLTALDRVEDRVAGLERGADDYLVKPFAFEELLARVGALVRRRRRDQAAIELVVGELRLDLLHRQAWRAGEPIALQPREFRLLELLVRNAGAVVSRMMLLEQVWNYRFDPQTKVLQTHLSRLRAKLNARGRPDLIETVRSVGYRIRVP